MHNNCPYRISMDNVTVQQAGARHIAEIKTGAEIPLGTQSALWFNLGPQTGNNTYKNTPFRVGTKFIF